MLELHGPLSGANVKVQLRMAKVMPALLLRCNQSFLTVVKQAGNVSCLRLA